MQAKHLFVLIHIRNKGEVGTINILSPPVFYWPFIGCVNFVDLFCSSCFVFVCHSVLSVLCCCGKGLTSWLSCMLYLSFIVFLSHCHMVSCIGCI